MTGNVQRVRHAGRAFSVDFDIGDFRGDSLFEPVAQPLDPGDVFFVGCRGQVHRLREPDNVGNVFGSPPPARFLMAAEQKGAQGRAAPDEENTDPFRGVNFMPRKGEEIDLREVSGQVDRNFGDRLCGIGVEDDFRIDLFDEVRQPFDRKDDAGLVVGVHHRNEERFARRDRAGQFGNVEVSRLIDRYFVNGEAAPCEFPADFEHCGMLHCGGDDLFSFRVGGRRAEDCRIVAFGCAGGKEDFARLAAEVGRDAPARGGQDLLNRLGGFVKRTRIKILDG